jgi:hypothetical protein
LLIFFFQALVAHSVASTVSELCEWLVWVCNDVVAVAGPLSESGRAASLSSGASVEWAGGGKGSNASCPGSMQTRDELDSRLRFGGLFSGLGLLLASLTTRLFDRLAFCPATAPLVYDLAPTMQRVAGALAACALWVRCRLFSFLSLSLSLSLSFIAAHARPFSRVWLICPPVFSTSRGQVHDKSAASTAAKKSGAGSAVKRSPTAADAAAHEASEERAVARAATVRAFDFIEAWVRLLRPPFNAVTESDELIPGVHPTSRLVAAINAPLQ